MAIHLLLEGLDFSGKTSAANNYAKNSSTIYQVNYSKLTEQNPFHDFATEMAKKGIYNSAVTGKLYLAGIIHDILSYKDDETQIIQDSTVATKSLAYHIVRETPYVIEELHDLLEKYPKPKYSYYLYADISTRIERMHKRMKEDPYSVTPTDLVLIKDPKMFEKQEEILREISMNHFNSRFLDTTNMSELDVLKILQKETAT